MPVLKTRLYKPVIDNRILVRQRLVTLFQNGNSYPLTLVVASAGYGKSIMVSQALEYTRTKYCWISLHDDCNDERIFLNYLVMAVCEVFPDSLHNLSDTLGADLLPPQNTLVSILVNELCELSEPINIVFDDYHFIHQKNIHAILEGCLEYPTDKFKFTLITRFDPGIKQSKLRAKAKVHEIRAIDLLFNTQEIIQLAKIWYQIDISLAQAETIDKLSEGWIIGIRLILHQISKGQTIEDALNILMRKKGGLTDYLFEEMLNEQPENIQKYLLTAALFDRFNIDLLQDLFFEPDTEKKAIILTLERLIQQAIFIIPLNEENTWYRYHHMIHKFLAGKCLEVFDKNQLNDVYIRAIHFFDRNSLWEEAIDYGIKSNNTNYSVSIIEQHYSELINTEQVFRLERWINKIPANTIEQNATLLIIRSFLAESKKDYATMESDLARVQELIFVTTRLQPPNSKILGEYCALRVCLCFFQGQIEKSIEFGKKALYIFKTENDFMKEFALGYFVLSLCSLGQCDYALKVIDEIQSEQKDAPDESIMRQEVTRILNLVISGKLTQIINSANLVLNISKSKNYWISYNMANYFLAMVHYMQNNLNEIHDYFKNATTHRFYGRPFWVIHAYFIEAKRLLAIGEIDRLNILLEELSNYSKNFESPMFYKQVVTFQVEIALSMNDRQRIIKFLPNADFNTSYVPFLFYVAQLTRIKLGLKFPDIVPANETKNLLDSFITKFTDQPNTQFLIQAFPLLCSWHLKSGDKKHAMEALEKAVNLSKNECYIQPILECDNAVIELFHEMYSEQIHDPAIAKMLDHVKAKILTNQMPKGYLTITQIPIKDEFGFNDNELKILDLAAKGYRNKEIANELFLSEGTIKTYFYRIYKKMGVTNRISALTKLKKQQAVYFPSQAE